MSSRARKTDSESIGVCHLIVDSLFGDIQRRIEGDAHFSIYSSWKTAIFHPPYKPGRFRDVTALLLINIIGTAYIARCSLKVATDSYHILRMYSPRNNTISTFFFSH